MSEPRKHHNTATPAKAASMPSAAKKRYTKPDFKHEKVFETMALACGKLASTQAQCRFNRRNS
jgi:hypothetical protein